MQKVVVDTNVWLSLDRDHLDVLTQLHDNGFEPVLLDSVFTELSRLSAGTTKHAASARLALSLIKRKGLKTVSCSKPHADDAILQYCKENDAAVATYDAALKKLLRGKGVRIITPTRRARET